MRLDPTTERARTRRVRRKDRRGLLLRSRARELHRAPITWRKKHHVDSKLLTEATVDLAEDRELLSLMVEAGFEQVVLDIETPELDGLRECQKFQNTQRGLIKSIHVIREAGLEVMGCVLTALPRARLYRRLREKGGLPAESTGNNTEACCNVAPRMRHHAVEQGYRELLCRLYEPPAFYRRVPEFLERCPARRTRRSISGSDLHALVVSVWVLGLRERGRRATGASSVTCHSSTAISPVWRSRPPSTDTTSAR